MDPSAGDPSAYAQQWPLYDEDPNETFTGPEGIVNLFNEEQDDEEYYDDDDEDGTHQEEPLETSASHRVDPNEVTHAETVSGHTHLA